MRPLQGEVLHFSEDPTLTAFHPHVAASARVPVAYVWAVDAQRAPAYWFPRQCPRVLAWVGSGSTSSDAAHVIGPSGASRVHAVEYAWLERMRTVRLYAYRLPAAPFHPFTEPESARRAGEPESARRAGEPEPARRAGEPEPARRAAAPEPSAHVARVPVRPLGPPEPVGDLFALHDEAGIELRVLPQLWTFWAAVTDSTLGFSGIRLRNARPTPTSPSP